MNKKFSALAAVGFLLTAMLLIAVPAGAQSVDDKIKALEQELSSLKSQQMELKKEATAAAAALPAFGYRPGNGVSIEAADKSWGIRFSIDAHLRMLFESGQDAVGRTNGEVMLRRWRPSFFYCIDNCLYEIEMTFDNDGFGTGNAKNSINTATSSIMHRGVTHFHLENLNPFLPTVDIGGDVSTSFSLSRQGSSSVGTQMEYDLLTRFFVDDGLAGWGYVFNWDDRSLSRFGIPGRIGRAQFAVATVRAGDDNLSSNTDRKNFNLYANIFPFSELKNKWLQGLATLISPGITWEIGPYRLRAMGAFMQAEDGNFTPPPAGGAVALRGKKRANNFLIGHDLFLWSPKGWLTGNVNTPGAVYIGTHFERNNVSCEIPRCNPAINGGQFHRGVYVVREWDLWYFIAPRMSIGGSLLWYDASNLTTTVQKNLGVNKNGRPGGGGNWLDGNLNWRYQF